MRLKISYSTHYSFADPVTYGLQQLRMTPKTSPSQKVLSWGIEIEGGKKEVSYEDYHRNHVDLISFDAGTTSLEVKVEGEVEITESHGIVGPHIGCAPLWLYQRQTPRTRVGQGCREIIRSVSGETDLARMHALSHAIGAAVVYETGTSDVEWGAEEVLTAGRGVCQDHAHVFLACARNMGLPARYVSGFLMMDDRIEQNATHAWAEVHIDGLGWVGFDISNEICPDERYVRVATGLDYSQAAPVTGMRVGGTTESLDVAIRVAQQ